MAISFKGAHFPKEVILMGVRWYVAYPLSTRHVEELMEERGVEVDHSTINRWVIKYSPQLEEAFHRHKRPVWVSWRMDETYIKVKGKCEFIPIYGTRCLRGKEAHAMAGGQGRGLQSRLPAFLDIPSVTVDEFQRLMPSFEAAIQAPMGLCAPSIVSGCTSHSGT